MIISERFFREVIANIIILCCIITVFAVSFFPRREILPISTSDVKVYYKGNEKNPYVSLMFNVYDNQKEVLQILEILQENDVNSTFFVSGSWADKNGEAVKKIAEYGNEIANHGYFQKDLKNLSYDKNCEEIIVTERLLQAITETKTNLFTPPSGSYGKATLTACKNLGYQVIMRSKDTLDLQDNDVEAIYNRATKNIQNGDLILMHPTPHTVKALDRVLKYYRKKGLQQVVVSRCIE